MDEKYRFKRIGGANGRLCKECGNVEVNCECNRSADKKITCDEGTIWTANQIAGYIRENGRLIGRTGMINTERSQREVEMIEEYAKEYHQSQLKTLKDPKE